MNRKTQLVSMAVAAALAGSLTGVARADQPAAVAAVSPEQLQTVVVTATKRQTLAQNTPISMTVLTSADIANRGLTDFNTLTQGIPDLAMRTAGPGMTEYEMRGLNSAGGNTSMVGVYLDEVALSSPASEQLGKVIIDPNLYDLARTEVLHGPQGTLYGASSMGGTVRLIPAMPELGTFDASGETTISDTGSGGSINFAQNGMVNLPFGSTAALRLVGSHNSQSGWLNRYVLADGAVTTDAGANPTNSRPAGFYTVPLLSTATGVNTDTSDSFRAILLYKPNDQLSITPMLMWQQDSAGAPNAVDVNGSPTDPTMPSAKGHYEIYDTAEPQWDRFTLGSLKIEYAITPDIALTSITGLWSNHSLVSQDGTEENSSSTALGSADPTTPPAPYDTSAGGLGPTGPGPFGPGVEERDYTRQVSEELRVASTGNAPLQWLAGYYYQDLNSEWDMWSVNPQAIPLGIGDIYVDYMPQTILQNAFFGNVSWEFSHGLKASAGVRWYHYSYSQRNTEWGDFTPYGFDNLLGLNGPPTVAGNTKPFDTNAANSANGTNPRFNLTWQIDPDHMVYGTVAKGFRLGGTDQPFVGFLTPVTAATCPYGNPPSLAGLEQCGLQTKLTATPTTPGHIYTSIANFPNVNSQGVPQFNSDSVWDYEIGTKNELFEHRALLNLTAYFERWTDPQIATNISGFGFTVNGGNANIYGLEAEFRANLGYGWDFATDWGYVHSKFLSDSPIDGIPKGFEVPDTPKITGSTSLNFHQELTDNLTFFGNMTYSYVGSRYDLPYGVTVYLNNINQTKINLQSYGILNLRAGVRTASWSAALFVNNATDNQVLLDPQPQINLAIPQFTRYIVNQPITYGMDVTYDFGGK
ncbi:MAG TPA: TonB-dependent receptor [Steroidobacteraceae bacterium]|nr:TonB-dependent receptor [Steroidobacteraceae bacterium]